MSCQPRAVRETLPKLQVPMLEWKRPGLLINVVLYIGRSWFTYRLESNRIVDVLERK